MKPSRTHNPYMVGFIALAISIALVLFAWAVFAQPVHAMTHFAGEWDSVPDNIRSWFKSVRAPNGVPCCDIADGHRTTWRGTPQGYEVPIEGQWIPVPPGAVVYNAGNPFEEAVVWYVKQQGDPTAPNPVGYHIRCFVPGDAV